MNGRAVCTDSLVQCPGAAPSCWFRFILTKWTWPLGRTGANRDPQDVTCPMGKVSGGAKGRTQESCCVAATSWSLAPTWGRNQMSDLLAAAYPGSFLGA